MSQSNVPTVRGVCGGRSSVASMPDILGMWSFRSRRGLTGCSLFTSIRTRWRHRSWRLIYELVVSDTLAVLIRFPKYWFRTPFQYHIDLSFKCLTVDYADIVSDICCDCSNAGGVADSWTGLANWLCLCFKLRIAGCLKSWIWKRMLLWAIESCALISQLLMCGKNAL